MSVLASISSKQDWSRYVSHLGQAVGHLLSRQADSKEPALRPALYRVTLLVEKISFHYSFSISKMPNSF